MELRRISPSNEVAVDRDPLNASNVEATVIVWDYKGARRQLIGRVIEACGARSVTIEGLLAIQSLESSLCCNIAVVAVGIGASPSGLGLEIIRRLKSKGFKVVCYEDDTQAWPLGIRCQALLAGSVRLLDSTQPDFIQEVQYVLAQMLRAEVARQDEVERIKGEMKRLGVVGESQALISIFRWVLRVITLGDLPILITGETGTGKELVARALYQLDAKWRSGPFVALNCGAINSNLAESELFGHRRGAFTGADRDRKGMFRSAQGGILFLDEIGELDSALQAKLLRVLQENRVLAVGEDQEVPISLRVVAATNRDLNEMVRQGRFRSDLFYRLNILSVYIPPLRERPADVKPLIEHFLKKYRSLNPIEISTVDPNFIEAFKQIELPGNVRELDNLVRRALMEKSDNTPLNFCDLPAEVWLQLSKNLKSLSAPIEKASEEEIIQQDTTRTPHAEASTYMASLLDANRGNLSKSLSYCERLLLEAALRLACGNQSQAARLLGITPRSVYNKIRKHQLSPSGAAGP